MLFLDIPDDTILHLEKINYYCPICFTSRKNARLKVKTTGRFIIKSIPYRECLVFHNPYCSCSRVILIDGTQEIK